MSPLGAASTVFSLLSAASGGSASQSAKVGQGDFRSSLALRMASIRNQSVDSLLGGLAGGSEGGGLDALFNGIAGFGNGVGAGASDALATLGLPQQGRFGSSSPFGLSAQGRNLSLFDPESAYRMMSDINQRDVTYKAQFAELSEMKAAVLEIGQAGAALGKDLAAGDATALAARLQSFAAEYNDWVGRFGGTVKDGGLLTGTQAAEVSLYELRQSVGSLFNGAGEGVRGLGDIGFSIDPATQLATVDGERLQAMLAQNPKGVFAAVSEFSQNFARSAELLVSANNFIPNRLDNLDRAIDYISDNKASLQAEFGLGDVARPSAQVARALAAYQQMVKAA